MITSLLILSILLIAYDLCTCEDLESDEHPELSATVERERAKHEHRH